MTIWLLILPERFKEWYKNRSAERVDGIKDYKVMILGEKPTFPIYWPATSNTGLGRNEKTQSYELLPPSWNLLECFKFFLEQEDQWNTNSIDAEFSSQWDVKSKKKMPPEQETLPDSDVQKEKEKDKETKDENENNDNSDVQEATPIAIKTSSNKKNDKKFPQKGQVLVVKRAKTRKENLKDL